MLKLSIMTEQELNQIFGTLDSLIPLHEGRREHPSCWPLRAKLTLFLPSVYIFLPLVFISHCITVTVGGNFGCKDVFV